MVSFAKTTVREERRKAKLTFPMEGTLRLVRSRMGSRRGGRM